MTMTAENFLKTDATPRAPVAILREQAEWFESVTNGQVVGEIIQREDFDDDGKRFHWTLKLRAPALGNYRYRLLSIEYGIDPYPLILRPDEDVFTEICESEQTSSESLLPQYAPVTKAKISLGIFRSKFMDDVQNHELVAVLSKLRLGVFEAETEEQFVELLRLIFDTKRVAKVINAIRAQIAA